MPVSSDRSPGRRQSQLWPVTGSVLVAAIAILFPLRAWAAPAGGLSVSLAGQSVAGSTSSHPVTLKPVAQVPIVIRLTNATSRSESIATVELQGKVIGLTFISYDTTVDFQVGPGRTATLRYDLDLSGLAGQATGLLPTSITLLDPGRHVVASESLVTDVRGSIRSVYGLYGLALVVLTGLGVASCLLALARGRLPVNRFGRGLRFLVPGIGLGLVFVFSLSAFRVMAPTNRRELSWAVLGAVILFGIGFLTPTPDPDDADEIEEEDGLDFGADETSVPGAMPGEPTGRLLTPIDGQASSID